MRHLPEYGLAPFQNLSERGDYGGTHPSGSTQLLNFLALTQVIKYLESINGTLFGLKSKITVNLLAISIIRVQTF